MEIKNFTARAYQLSILETCKEKNTLVCIPTGLGKTKIAILLLVEQLNKKRNTKAILLTPTKPLANQIYNEIKECTDIGEDKIVVLTGAITPEKRKKLYESSTIIVATPQTINEDIQNKRVTLNEFSLLVIDEAHRSREKFANTLVAREFINNQPSARILALTASPGSTKIKIDEICKNLNIEAIEIRSEEDEDIAEFVQKKEIEYLKVELSKELKEVHELIKEVYQERMEGIKSFIPYKPLAVINKTDLIALQLNLQKQIKLKNHAAFFGLSLVAQLLKLSHAMEMLETQGLKSLDDFLKKLETEQTKAAVFIIKNNKIIKAKELCRELIKKDIDHPKIEKLKEVVKEAVEKKKEARIIIFTTYRNTVENIVNLLNGMEIKTTKLVGQKEGLTQKQQIAAIEEFNAGKYSCLVTTSIGEEGIHVGEADIAIFYDNTPSSIRKIQRTGRVGRLKSGKVIFMITLGTRDAAYFWKSKRDEKKMKEILYKMKDKNQKKQTELSDFKDG